MADALATMHSEARIDAANVEFVRGPPMSIAGAGPEVGSVDKVEGSSMPAGRSSAISVHGYTHLAAQLQSMPANFYG